MTLRLPFDYPSASLRDLLRDQLRVRIPVLKHTSILDGA